MRNGLNQCYCFTKNFENCTKDAYLVYYVKFSKLSATEVLFAKMENYVFTVII